MSEFPATKLTKINRIPERGSYERAVIYPIIDEALICHVGFEVDGQPIIIPTIHARLDDMLYLHGAKASRMLKHIAVGHPVCVAFTLLDGIIFARSLFEHSLRYRSVVAFGSGGLLENAEEKLAALRVISEHVWPGRWQEARLPNAKELDATSIAAVQITKASAKVQDGFPTDAVGDLALPVWAGVIPIQFQAGEPIPDPQLPAGLPFPEYLKRNPR